MINSVIKLVIFIALACAQSSVRAEDASSNLSFEDLSLEQLMQVEVTTVSKKAQKLSDAAAAIFVVNSEDIRRSGATSIPEALRIVPGLHVAKVDGSRWAISSRSGAGLFSNSLLVLIDGRTVYSPLFSGVFWEQPDLLLADVDRIEVIRGPGATLWGANAVNGIINIITKESSKTQGLLATAGYGSELEGTTALRYGGEVGENGNYRLYGKFQNWDNSETLTGAESSDDFDSKQGGFRADFGLGADDNFTLQGDIFDGDGGFEASIPSVSSPTYSSLLSSRKKWRGGNILGRWTHDVSESSQTSLQVYYDKSDRKDVVLNHDIDTLDIDFQNTIQFNNNNQTIWGLGYRRIEDGIENITETVVLDPDSRAVKIFSGFIQNETLLADEAISINLGSKFERNDYTGFEFQPNARARWSVTDKSTLWAAASRAVRTPSRVENDADIAFLATPGTGGLANLLVIEGSDALNSENLAAYEAGYRYQAAKDLSIDLAVFYDRYDDVTSIEMGTPTPILSSSPPYVRVPYVYDNMVNRDVFGGELLVDWEVTDAWKLQASYSFLKVDVSLDSGSTNLTGTTGEDSDPVNKFTLRSLLNLTDEIEFDGFLRFVDSVPYYSVDSYLELDLRLGWHITDDLEVSILGQNLLDNAHQEYVADFINVTPSQIERSVFGRITWRYDS